MSTSVASAAWPTPGALAGVKSRTKVIVKGAAGEICVCDDRVCSFSNISLTGQSRILAVGAAGHAIAQMVLKKHRPVSGEISHVGGLVMVHLGPHLAGPSASRDAHARAMAAAMRVKPHIVVLDESLSAGSQTWIQTFDEALHGDPIRAFKGAVIVCVATEPVGPPCHGCSEQWAEASGGGSMISQQEIKSRLGLIENVLVGSSAAFESASTRKTGRELADVGHAELVEEARELSEYCFEEDLFEAAREEGDTVTLLTERSSSDTKSLRGYICYKSYERPRAELHISRLAVPKSQRGRGLAKLLMHWIINKAARSPSNEIEFVTLSALESAVPFYAKLGFVVAPSRKILKDGDDPQTWMEIPNVPAVGLETSAVAVTEDVESSPPMSGGREASAVEVAAAESEDQVIKVEGWQPCRSPKELTMRIVEIETLLQKNKTKAFLTDEQRDKLMDEMQAMKSVLDSSRDELAERIMDVEKRIKGSKKKNKLSDTERAELSAELQRLNDALSTK